MSSKESWICSPMRISLIVCTKTINYSSMKLIGFSPNMPVHELSVKIKKSVIGCFKRRNCSKLDIPIPFKF